MTKPSRSTSNGREADAGSSWRPDSAPMRAKAAMAIGTTTASAPPASTTSEVPSRMSRAPSPTAWLPAAQAVATQKLGPVQPSSMATMAGVALGIIIGTRNGRHPGRAPLDEHLLLVLQRGQPADADTGHDGAAGRVGARLAGVADGVDGGGEAELGMRSTRRTSLGPRYSTASKSLTSQAKRTGRSVGVEGR